MNSLHLEQMKRVTSNSKLDENQLTEIDIEIQKDMELEDK